ncbi:glycosyl hydrolase [Halalkalibacter urbisdiaboli]|uniref:glycosyl hydrolase n=1 Tax=Halalkalibacter urbisdiaboli TaxID=1960589 RepID=UPI000B442B10|nr:glycosyl hydrolase [Halalkalibacter urbisdiaboli]
MNRLKKCFICFLAILLVFPAVSFTDPISTSAAEVELKMADPNASKYTKELFAFLQDVSGQQVLFGQQHATDEGLTLQESGNRVGSSWNWKCINDIR